MRALVLISVALTSSACVNARVEQYKEAETGGLVEGERVVILAREHHNTHEAEESFTECLGNELRRVDRRIVVHDSREFIDGLYPWLEPSTAPLRTEELPALLARPGVSEQIASTGVRYVVWVDGDTDRVDGGGSVSCAAGPGGAGCFGLAWWETDSKYEAAVWDLKNTVNAGTVSTDVNGRSVMPAVVIPVPLIARTQSHACKGMAGQLAEFLVVDPVATTSASASP